MRSSGPIRPGARFESWLATLQAHRLDPASLRPASADASFRRYLRIAAADGSSRIVMDAPPPQEDVRPFVQIAALIEQAGLNAPRVLAQDVAHGFLLLTDLGTRPTWPSSSRPWPVTGCRVPMR